MRREDTLIACAPVIQKPVLPASVNQLLRRCDLLGELRAALVGDSEGEAAPTATCSVSARARSSRSQWRSSRSSSLSPRSTSAIFSPPSPAQTRGGCCVCDARLPHLGGFYRPTHRPVARKAAVQGHPDRSDRGLDHHDCCTRRRGSCCPEPALPAKAACAHGDGRDDGDGGVGLPHAAGL